MTLDQALLIGLITATTAGVVFALYRHRIHARWRRKDLLRDFISRWAAEIAVPTEADALRFAEDHLRFRLGLRLSVEKDAHFTLAFRLAPKGTQHQYEQFVEVRSDYIKNCHKLFQEIEKKCAERTGIKVSHWGEVKDWPEKVLLPNFVLTIYEQILGIKQGTFQLQDISYDIGAFSHSGQGFERKGLHLTTTYNAYDRLELAQAGDEVTLEHIKSIHRQMMEMDWHSQFNAEVERIREFQKKAEMLAHEVRDTLRKLEVL